MRGESWERAGVEEAANTIREIIRSVDEAAIISGNYWPDFADEIDGQLYGVGEILQWHRRKPRQ
jgi:hypothetical protein